MGKLAFDISTKDISNLVYARPGTGQYPPKIKIADSEHTLVRSPKILGVYLVRNETTSLRHWQALIGDSKWRLMTYKALGRSIANYAVPVWSTNASESNIGKI